MKQIIHKKKIFFIVIVLLFFSCEKKTYLKLPETELPDVLNCIFTPDSAWTVQIYNTLSIYDPYKFNFKKDLKPEIYENGTKIGELFYNTKNTGEKVFEYFTNPSLTINEDYEYFIKVPVDDKIIFATSKIPEKPEITNISLSNFNITNYNDHENADYGYGIEGNVQIIVKNKPDLKYYAVIVYYYADYILGSPITQITPVKTNLDYILYGELDEFETYAGKEGHIFKCDTTQENSIVTLSVDDIANVAFNDFNTIYVEIKSITKDYYLYQKSVKDQAYSRNDPFAESVPIHTNIQNGIGIFTSYNSVIDTFYIEN